MNGDIREVHITFERIIKNRICNSKSETKRVILGNGVKINSQNLMFI